MKDNIDEGDKIWTTIASPGSVYNGIMLDSFNWNSEGIILGLSDISQTWPIWKKRFLVLLILSYLEKNLVISKVHHLLYKSEVLRKYLEATFLAIRYAMMTRYKSACLNELLGYSSKEFSLIWRITSKMATNHELQWVILNANVMA